MGMTHIRLPGTLLPALAELCSIKLHVGHVPISVWNICLCKTTDGQDTPFVPHHNRTGKPLKGLFSRLRERCISMAKHLGLGSAGVSLRTCMHILDFPAVAGFLWSWSYAPFYLALLSGGGPQPVHSENASSQLLYLSNHILEER